MPAQAQDLNISKVHNDSGQSIDKKLSLTNGVSSSKNNLASSVSKSFPDPSSSSIEPDPQLLKNMQKNADLQALEEENKVSRVPDYSASSAPILSNSVNVQKNVKPSSRGLAVSNSKVIPLSNSYETSNTGGQVIKVVTTIEQASDPSIEGEASDPSIELKELQTPEGIVVPKKAIFSPVMWKGWYIGGDLKGGLLTFFYSADRGQRSYDSSFTGIGAYVGYNAETEHGFIYGIETDLSLGYASGAFTDWSPDYQDSQSVAVKHAWHGATRLRWGYGFNRLLPYITGGLSYGNFDIIATGNDNSYDNVYGYTFGGGVEYGLMKHIMLRLEGRYMRDFGIFSYIEQLIDSDSNSIHKSLSSTEIRLGLSYKF